MKNIGITLVLAAFVAVSVPTNTAQAQQNFSFVGDRDALISYLIALILDLQRGNSFGGGTHVIKTGGKNNVGTKIVGKPRSNNNSSSNDDEPDVETDTATNIEEDEAELRGEVDMNDFNNGEVFFVYGEDEDQIEDVEDDYDSYSDVDEDGDDLQKERVDRDLDRSADYELTVRGLDEDTEYFYQICVGYEDDDDDDVIECGGVEDFETDDDNGSSNNSNDDEPEARTDEAEDIDENNARISGTIDMNDFNNGEVFFVYGEDEDQIEDVEDDYDTYDDIDEDGDDLQKFSVDDDLDDDRYYWELLFSLDEDTEYFYQICVEYEDDDDDDVLECGGVESFTTDED